MRVSNPDRSPVIVESRDPAHAEPGFADLVGDGFPVLQTGCNVRRNDVELRFKNVFERFQI